MSSPSAVALLVRAVSTSWQSWQLASLGLPLPSAGSAAPDEVASKIVSASVRTLLRIARAIDS
jgi:hypothetical protein